MHPVQIQILALPFGPGMFNDSDGTDGENEVSFASGPTSESACTISSARQQTASREEVHDQTEAAKYRWSSVL